jgi:hypothetical protein
MRLVARRVEAAIAWNAFRDAAADDLTGGEVIAASAGVQLNPWLQ